MIFFLYFCGEKTSQGKTAQFHTQFSQAEEMME